MNANWHWNNHWSSIVKPITIPFWHFISFMIILKDSMQLWILRLSQYIPRPNLSTKQNLQLNALKNLTFNHLLNCNSLGKVSVLEQTEQWFSPVQLREFPCTITDATDWPYIMYDIWFSHSIFSFTSTLLTAKQNVMWSMLVNLDVD